MDVSTLDIRKLSRGLARTLGSLIPTRKASVTYITERQSWAIAAEGRGIKNAINEIEPEFRIRISNKPYLCRSSVFHFGSQFMVENWLDLMPRSSKIVVSYFHGKFGDGPEIDRNLRYLLNHSQRIERFVVSYSGMKHRLTELGIDEDSITQIPIGVSTEIFTPNNSHNKQMQIRNRYGIPQDRFVIGSFQKDGAGWEQGLAPKWIKGPDLLLQTLEVVSRKLPLFVLLSGPSRGYVIEGLKRAGIPHKHLLIEEHSELVNLYHALDLYLMTSREEGGPKGLLEALAAGCPVVSTPVGMATDMSSTSSFFQVSRKVDVSELSELTINIGLSGDRFLHQNVLSGLVQHCSWEQVGKKHLLEVYKPLIESEGH